MMKEVSGEDRVMEEEGNREEMGTRRIGGGV